MKKRREHLSGFENTSLLLNPISRSIQALSHCVSFTSLFNVIISVLFPAVSIVALLVINSKLTDGFIEIAIIRISEEEEVDRSSLAYKKVDLRWCARIAAVHRSHRPGSGFS